MRIICNSRFCAVVSNLLSVAPLRSSDLEALVLEHTFDRSILAGGRQLRLKHNAEGAVADNLALRVLHVSCLAGNTILHFLANDFCEGKVSHGAGRSR